ncbi:MAG: DUF262 domain-containing HNH endonuclease family protein [Clostridiales bacterium]|nr:DUF262 domain-containing HNH endonuclease family protein [Clostridiales bacterium]MCF8021083.1 DUF262 domain-containing HNH endonuclease family protein [Clostridiales bacterium]
MASGKIDADKIILQKIFSQDFWFVIPEYQRSYVWQSDNVSELIEDLYYAFKNKPNSQYFLGSLVLKRLENDEYPEYEVLDGQQRLTTFFMMLAVLRDLLDNKKFKENLQGKIYQEEDVLDKVPSRQRITYKIRDDVEDFIYEYIIKLDGTTHREDLTKKKEKNNISISNMANAILVLIHNLQNKDDLQDFVKFLFNEALFIYVSTDNHEDAFRMFTILNDRGIPLTSADIIKSINIGNLETKENVNKYAKIWEDIEGRHGEYFDRFLGFVRTILVKDKARTNLLDEFESKIYKAKKLSKGKETFKLVQEYDEIYEDIIELGNSNLSNEFKNLITIMKIGLRSEDWIPPLMFYYYKFGSYGLDQFLRNLEYKFTGNWVCGLTPTLRLDAMNNILKVIENTSFEQVDEKLLNNNELFNIDIETFKNNISGNIYKKQYARYLLLKIEFLLSDNTVHLTGYNYITVEHVLPQNPDSNSQWVKDFFDEEREYWTDKLANLVLISKKKNSTLNNLDFKEKKERYLNKRIDPFHGNKIFIQRHSEWNPRVLEERQNELVNLLCNN